MCSVVLSCVRKSQIQREQCVAAGIVDLVLLLCVVIFFLVKRQDVASAQIWDELLVELRIEGISNKSDWIWLEFALTGKNS